jgi:hypothetical protein
VARDREARAGNAAEVDAWLAVRSLVHVALARRGSRVAVYDLREALARAAEPLPEGFAEAAGMVGDESCLESIAERLARMTAGADHRLREWHEALLRAGRAIVERERLTRRHAVMKKIARLSPGVAGALLTAWKK